MRNNWHFFNVEFAKKYGLVEAIFFWLFRHELDNGSIHTFFEDEKYWVAISIEEIKFFCPYLTEQKIALALHKLMVQGAIELRKLNEEYRVTPTEEGINACITNM